MTFTEARRAALLLALSCTIAGCATTRQAPLAAQRPPEAETPAASAIAPLNYTSRTLANGLRVYAIQDKISPNVSVQVWYDVGSKDDPRGRSGFAHLFEHLMFKSTRNLVPEQFDRLTEDVGGFNNASTNDDYTNYYEVVPANHLERLLWAEAERMGSLVVEPGFFASERDVVKEELRRNYLAAPYGKLYLYYPMVAYDVHPYARPGIGSIEELDAAAIDDVRAFHATYYRPDNAVLVVAGNFDERQLDAWIDRYFGPIAKPATIIPRVGVTEPVRTELRRVTTYEANTPLPAALVTYPVPPRASPDAAVIDLINFILTAGQSSRLYQSLVYRDRLASGVDSFADIKQGRGNLVLVAMLASGKTAEQGEAAIRAEIARLRDAPVAEGELAEAKNEFLTAALQSRETVDGKASQLAEAVIVTGDPAAADRRLAQVAAVTAADIQRVSRAWLRDERSGAIRYNPVEAKPAGALADRIQLASTVQTAPLVAPLGIRVVQPAPEAERVPPPTVGRELAASLPKPVTQTLGNGLTVVSVERRDLPLATAVLVVGGGAAADPKGKAGLASLTASLITQGTTSRSASEIARAVEALGASFQSDADWDGATLSLTIKSDQLDPALAIMADVARNPSFAPEELERQRTLAVDAVNVALSDPDEVAGMVGAKALYGDSLYGHVATGTPASLKAIGRDDVAAAYADAWAPGNVTLVLSGDIDAAQARALAERHFGNWTAPAAARNSAGAVAPSSERRLVVVDMPGAGQAAVAVTRGALARSDPRFYRALVANAVLGTGFSSRLNQEIRIKRGLAYGARSSVDARRGVGPFVASTSTKNESASEVLGLILAEMRRLGAEPIPAAELTTRKAVLTGGFGRAVETTSGLAGAVAGYIIDGVPPDEIARYTSSVNAVTPEDARAAAADLLDPRSVTIVIVGDAKLFLPELRREQKTVTIIPAASLNLDSPRLR